LEALERQAIFMSLERNKWRKLAACRKLGFSKYTLRRRIATHEIPKPGNLMASQ